MIFFLEACTTKGCRPKHAVVCIRYYARFETVSTNNRINLHYQGQRNMSSDGGDRGF
jgi:hypothetical protein